MGGSLRGVANEVVNELTKNDPIGSYQKYKENIDRQIAAALTNRANSIGSSQNRSISKGGKPGSTGRLRGVAVYPFAAKGGVDPSLAEAVSGLFSNYIAASNGLRLVGEEVITALAKQVGLEQSCGSESCQVDLAAQAKADYLVRGDLLRIQEDYYLTTQVIDLVSKETVFADRIKTNKVQIVDQTDNLAQKVRDSLAQRR